MKLREHQHKFVDWMQWAAIGCQGVCLMLCTQNISAAASPQITGVGLPSGGKISLTWSGTTGACEIQRASEALAPAWKSVLQTSRTNAVIPLAGNSGFFRVVSTDPASSSLVVTTTNLSTGDVFNFTKQPQTNLDLVFDNLSDTNATTPVQNVLPEAELEKFDVAFDDAGGFTLMTPSGAPGGVGGVIDSSPGPGANEITYGGFLTNGTDMVLFSAVSGPVPLKSGVKPLDGGGASTYDPGAIVGNMFSASWCFTAWAGQALGCQAAAVSRTLGCVGFFPPKASGGYGYLSSTGTVTITVTATNFILTGSCDAKCVTCCKDLGTGVLSNCQ